MQTILIIVHLVIVLALIAVVLLQRSEGGGLGVGGGGSGGGGVSGFMSGRGQASALTRATAILAGLFFLTSLSLTIMAGYSGAPRSILDGAAPGGAPGAPQGGNVLEQLQRLQGDQPATGAPATGIPAPVAPATPSAPQVPQSQ